MSFARHLRLHFVPFLLANGRILSPLSFLRGPVGRQKEVINELAAASWNNRDGSFGCSCDRNHLPSSGARSFVEPMTISRHERHRNAAHNQSIGLTFHFGSSSISPKPTASAIFSNWVLRICAIPHRQTQWKWANNGLGGKRSTHRQMRICFVQFEFINAAATAAAGCIET